MKLVGDRPCDFTLNRKEIGYIPIVGLRPHVRVGRRLDELRVNSEPIADALALPSKRWATPSCWPISREFRGFPLL